MSKYYLVAKSKTSDKFEIVKIKGNEIYSDESDMLERCFNLERIDLFTSRFKNEESLKGYLKNNGRVNLDDYDLFIVARNGQKIKFLNCLYNFGTRVELLRSIMQDSDQNKLTANSKTASSLLDDFIKNMFTMDNYYNFVVYGFTDIYKKFIDYVKARNVSLNELLGAKYKDGRWAMTSYNLHRSIIDSYQTYNRHYKDRDMFTSVANSQRKDRLNRESIIPLLLVQTDKDYVDGQISLFDLPVEEETKVEEKNVTTVSSKPIKKVASKVSHEDMLVEVMTYLDKFPRGMFIGDDLHFNERIFPGFDVSGLNKISVRLKRAVNGYTVNKYHLDRAYEYGCSTRELSEDLAADKKDILRLLESDGILLKFYNFCHLYDKIEEEYESKVKGDNKVYGKREDN